MNLKSPILGGLTAILASAPLAGEMQITVQDAYARSNNPKVAAAFMQLMNAGDSNDRLIAAQSDAAKRVELHSHQETDGIMKMIHVEDGFALPAGAMTALERGGKHIMFMGLTEPLKQGDEIPVTLTFEKAGEMVLSIPVDNARKPSHGGQSHGAGHSDEGS